MIKYGRAPDEFEDGLSVEGEYPFGSQANLFRPEAQAEFRANEREGAISGLMPGTRYTFQVYPLDAGSYKQNEVY